MDTVKKEKHRFNFVDVIIILIVVAAIAVLAQVFYFGKNGGDMVEIYYAVECAEINPLVAYNMVPGETFFDAEKDHKMGVGVDCIVGDKENLVQTADGRVLAANQPYLRSVIIILSATVEKKTYEYSIDDYYSVQVGQDLYVSSPSISGYGYCIALAEVNSEQDKADFVKKAKELTYVADVKANEPETGVSTNE